MPQGIVPYSHFKCSDGCSEFRLIFVVVIVCFLLFLMHEVGDRTCWRRWRGFVCF